MTPQKFYSLTDAQIDAAMKAKGYSVEVSGECYVSAMGDYVSAREVLIEEPSEAPTKAELFGDEPGQTEGEAKGAILFTREHCNTHYFFPAYPQFSLVLCHLPFANVQGERYTANTFLDGVESLYNYYEREHLLVRVMYASTGNEETDTETCYVELDGEGISFDGMPMADREDAKQSAEVMIAQQPVSMVICAMR